MSPNLLRRALCATALVLPAVLAVRAQAPLSIAPPVRPPQLVVSGAPETPVALQSVRISAEIAAGAALTEVTMVFHNPNRRVLEGELQFPLLEGQSVTGFAMDVDGKLRDAVPVERARGQAVFEDITRQRIDPGLLEKTEGNNYRLRVYPMLPGKTKTVVLRYAETLAAGSGGRRWRLPLEYAGTLGTFDLQVRVQGATAPRVAAAALGGLAFQRDGEGWTAHVARKDWRARGLLDLTVPLHATPAAHVQEFDGRNFFVAEVPLRAASAPRPAPKRVALAWDSSGSGATRDHAREFALLDAYFAWMREGEVVLARLRDAQEAPETFRIAGGNWRELRRALEATPYDGATFLGAFSLPEGADEVLLFSDGLQNIGDGNLEAKGKRVHAVSAATRADGARLKALAEKSGGRFVDLLASTPAEAAAALSRDELRVTAVDATGARNVVLQSPHPVNGRLLVAGELVESAARLRIEAGLPGQAPRVIEVPLATRAAAGRLAAQLWASLRIAELEGDADANKAEIRRVGTAFGLVTRETSLIVLDRVEDYVRHEIVPPAELRAEYDRLRQSSVAKRDADRRAHLERIVKLFQAKQSWWEKEFPKGPKPAPKPEALRDDRAPGAAATGAPPPRPAALAAPTPAPMAGAAQRAEVTGMAAAAKSADASTSNGAISIKLQPWRPDAPYSKRLRDANAAAAYKVYLDEKPGYAQSTAFYLDAADLLLEKGLADLAVRVLGNLAEMELGNRHVLRILGYRLVQAGRPAAAIPVFRRVLELSPEEPQSYRDLGLALAADKQHQKAIEMLAEVVLKPWHGRFPEIELVTLAELNAIVATASQPLDTSRIDARLLRNLPLDLRVVLAWDADNTDIDLWVTDPNGEKAFYGNPLSYQGGRMSQDFTGGYGPEEFSLKVAKPGKYKVEAQFYGHRQQVVAGATTLMLTLSTRFGTAQQQSKAVTLRLPGRGEVVTVGEFVVE